MDKRFLAFACFVLFVLASGVVLAIVPNGAQVTDLGNQTAPADAAGNHSAFAGNMTELNLWGYSVTQSWQGYFGNVSGTIMLADAGDRVMYNWSLASPQGEIYASRNKSVSWLSLHCFNFSATGTYLDDSANAGNTSLYGMNLTQLEASYNINYSSVDGVDETFNLNGADSHDLFYTSNLKFEEGECRSTRVYSNAGSGENNKFEEVLMYDSSTQSVVFASLLEEDTAGFDNRHHDFEMMVLEDGHGTDTSTTPYYFYVELQ